MIFANALKYPLIRSVVLAVFVIQPSFAMMEGDGEDERILPAFFKTAELTIPDEIAVEILHRIPRDENIIKDFSRIALTCKKGHELIGHPYFFELLRDVYLGDVPKKYISSLIEDKILSSWFFIPFTFQQPISSCSKVKTPSSLSVFHSVFQKLFAHQQQEVKRLYSILSADYQPEEIQGDGGTSLIMQLLQERKTALQKDLISLYMLYKSDAKGWRFQKDLFNQAENLLNDRNAQLIRELLTVQIQQVTALRNIQCNLRGAITRLSPEGIETINKWKAIINKIVQEKSPGAFGRTCICLACNNLRWLPDELFLTPLLHQYLMLDLRNNLLEELPDSIENFKDSIVRLYFGNVAPPTFRGTLHLIYKESNCRGKGNAFKEIPASILKLTNLQMLDCRSLGLEKFPSAIFECFPKLFNIKLDHNNLSLIPIAPEGRNIHITSVGNPGHGLLTFHGPTLCNRFDSYVCRPLDRMHHYVEYAMAANLITGLPVFEYAIPALLITDFLSFTFGNPPALKEEEYEDILFLKGTYDRTSSLLESNYEDIPSLEEDEYDDMPSLEEDEYDDMPSLEEDEYDDMPSLEEVD